MAGREEEMNCTKDRRGSKEEGQGLHRLPCPSALLAGAPLCICSGGWLVAVSLDNILWEW